MPDIGLHPTDPALQSALAGAPDQKLGRIVGLLDSLEDRGAADALLAAARPRLRDLRPARPLRFTRLLALPFEPMLVATDAWDGEPTRMPRAALTPIGQAVHAALPALAEAIELAALGRTMADAALVARLGAMLWPRAAETPLPIPPPGWMEAGLPREVAAPLLVLARRRWRQAGG
ncbi:hypothetical protein J4558_21475 [Leptolyngbya sp. 15MV]|nr:hypothetical protein J4558_21475 [Leptolyngbya sp. 15MV]